MKKILVFNIWLLCSVLMVPNMAMAECDVSAYPGAGKTLGNRGTQYIECSLVKGQPGMTKATVCQLYCDGTELKYLINKCVDGYYPMDEYPNAAGSYKRCGPLAEACHDAGKSVSADGKKCDCGGLMYEWSDTELKCVESEDYKACSKDSNAYWTIDYGCRCREPQQYYWDEAKHECRKKPDQRECEDIKGKLTTIITDNNTVINWNPGTGKCECIKDADGNDVGNPDEYYVDNLWRCVKMPYVLRREEVKSNKPAADAKQRKIYAIIDDLKRLSDDMGKSHWKNASGGFNTARLASDSIAGVVLGTVGGVITSNVIKKNQVKGGFEDINCTVGGQRVAGYADEFNVGIQ